MGKSPNDWGEKSHASWGKITVCRTSGMTSLFRSSLKHHHWITLRIQRAKVVDASGAHDFLAEEKELIEVSMSETQFARMVASINMGEGTACTIEYYNGERMPECPAEDRKKFVTEAHDEHLEDHSGEMRELLGRLQRMRSDKKRPTLKELDHIISRMSTYTGNFRSNQKYYREQFAEEMETIVEEAKTEIEAHILRAADKIGIERVSEEMPKLET